MQNAIKEAITFCINQGHRNIALAIPRTSDVLSPEDAKSLGEVSAWILPEDIEELDQYQPVRSQFLPAEYNWDLPESDIKTIVYVGGRAELNFRMAWKARTHGVDTIVYFSLGTWRKERLERILIGRVKERATVELNHFWRKTNRRFRMNYTRFLRVAWRRYYKFARTNPMVQKIIVRLLEPSFNSDSTKNIGPRATTKFFARRYLKAITGSQIPVLAETEFKKNRILLTNASLAAGGAERQVVNTMIGLKAHGYSDLLLLCEHVYDRPNHDFYLDILEAESIAVRQRIDGTLPHAGKQRDNVARLTPALNYLPEYLKQEILAYALEILEFRPQILHAWQDATSLKAGFAAALVGVPQILLNGRNMAPYNFLYFLPYMRPMYFALANSPNVTFLNNSNAGARDYERWIGLPKNSVTVLFNGLHENRFGTVDSDAQQAYRQSLGIAESSLVVGSIYRFNEEKDPLMWIRAAARIADKIPNVVFLILGQGPLRPEMEKLAAELQIAEKLRLPGVDDTPEVALSVMDVFLMSSRLEGTPNVCIEAQFMGVPVVAPNVGGTADTVRHGETGWIVEDRSARSLADKVIESLQNDEWRRTASKAAPIFARERFGFERMIDDTVSAYELNNDKN